MAKRILVLLLFIPVIFLWMFILLPVEYIRTGKVDGMNTPMDKLVRWAK